MQKKNGSRKTGGGVRWRIIPHQDFVVYLGFENPPPLYTTHTRSIHLPYEKNKHLHPTDQFDICFKPLLKSH